ncbi:hypothetical protein [Burkholderia vietnamiensis]|uniref:hypothetical protein n=1 Tax=Burkholderia vietnamiensis TaxID=60552 RepID=UPI0008413A1B|nr:hypothetical protein [Burkholderia vietnamiensis]AOJ99938.1 hypothetical protein WK23_15590 [Burkholderia vietnamiensis]
MALSGSYIITDAYAAVVPDGLSIDASAIPIAAPWTVAIPNAYVNIENVSGDQSRAVATATIYADSTKQSVVDRKTYMFDTDMNGPNFIAQAYAYLKTLPAFSGMTSV